MAGQRGKVKINHDYFSISTRWENLRYFLRQGHILSHVTDRIKWHYFPKFFLVPSFPTHLEVEASSACQMRCPMCKSVEMIKSGIFHAGLMDFELYKKIIEDCRKEPLHSIKLSWRGEPLLNPRIVEMIAYAKQQGIRDVAFLSNGERLNPGLTEALLDSGLDWISISFDGMGEIYNRIRKPAIFEETLEKIRYFRAYRDRRQRRKPLIRIQSVRSAIQGKEEDFLRLWHGVADRVNIIADQKRSIAEKDYIHDPNYICPSPWQRMCISWDGKVVQCYGDYLEGNILGDINEKSLKAIWQDQPFQELRRLMRHGKRLVTKPCRTCSDGGLTEEEEIILGDRVVKVARYIHQGIDVKEMDSSLNE
ncbi:MAG: SPASM domain-containing protein [Syntrophobacterales bacterium]|jgi:radical SAM protein with 4Fe4S-binding SPASM domain|nr:SPASM domain-containing protein [Syntrophobacterales bacterium]